MEEMGGALRAYPSFSGCAQLTHYTAEYAIWGEGPPLVIIPGLAGGFDLLGPLAKILAKNHLVVSYQLRGDENCFSLRRPFGLNDLVSDLRELLDVLCLESPDVMGVSFGGVLALEFASRFSHRLSKLIVQGSGVRYEEGLLSQVAKTVLSRFPLPADSPFINQFFNLLFGRPQKPDELFRFVTSQIWQTDQSVMSHRLNLVESFSMDGKAERISAPTLILAGDKDVLVSRRSLNDLHVGVENSELVCLPRCGHLAFVTHPELVAMHVERFLKS